MPLPAVFGFAALYEVVVADAPTFTRALVAVAAVFGVTFGYYYQARRGSQARSRSVEPTCVRGQRSPSRDGADRPG